MENRIRLLYAEDNFRDADLTRVHFESEAPEFELEIVQSGEQCLRTVRHNYTATAFCGGGRNFALSFSLV
jgi:hypothetical protein